MDRIWWKQITKASLFTEKVIDALAAGDSVVLSLPRHVPWYATLSDIIREGIVERAIQRSIDYVDGVNEPGPFLLDHCCKKEIRLQYREGKTYAAFLASQEAITLNSSIIWVENLDAARLEVWMDFIHEYSRRVPAGRNGGLFVLETRDEESVNGGRHLQCISFSSEISAYDKYTFCTLLSTTTIVDNNVRQYLAELVSSVCTDDIELCGECLAGGLSFARDPIAYLQNAAGSKCRSDGSLYDMEASDEELRYRIWESQIRMIFPLIERFRMQFVEEHREEIQRELPKETAFGEIIETPEDVEIGLLFFLTSHGTIQMRDNRECRYLEIMKDARNDLAHLNHLPFETVYEIMTGKRIAVTV